jgi:RNA polymerase sigma factor (sigma-70 family)
VQSRNEVAAWFVDNIVPHEAALRAWLRKKSVSEDEIGDIVQDAYVSIARLRSIDHIRSGKNYLFQAAKSNILMRVRRARLVTIDRLSDVDARHLADNDPGPERYVSAKLELQRVRQLIAELPERYREIVELRRLHGMPQREIAAKLGMTEHSVEALAARGLKMLLKAASEDDATDNTEAM